jgi:hypothetical protein
VDSSHGAAPLSTRVRKICVPFTSNTVANSLRRHYRSLTITRRKNSGGEIRTASDADVAIIADHAARIVSHTLLYTNNSKYPHSMYLVGLAEAWVFEAPFSTIPIATAALPAAGSFRPFVAGLVPTRDIEIMGGWIPSPIKALRYSG